MLKFEIDRKGTFVIRWPTNAAGILNLAQTFITYYTALPPTEQTLGINLPLLQT